MPWRAVRAFALRAAPLTLLVSLWWLIPAWVQASYGTDFLPFTESSGTIWATTSASESLRLMGFWVSYLGVDYTVPLATWTDARTLLYSPAVVAATLIVPALALAGFVWTRRWRYGPSSWAWCCWRCSDDRRLPRRHAAAAWLTYAYNHFPSLRVLLTPTRRGRSGSGGRCLAGGGGAAEAWRRLRGTGRPALGGAALAALVVALIALAGGRS